MHQPACKFAIRPIFLRLHAAIHIRQRTRERMEGQSVLVELASDPTEKSRKNKTGKDLLYAVQASGSTRPWLSQVSFPNMILLVCPTPTVKGNTRLLTETPQLANSIFLWRTTTLQLLSHTTDDRAATLSHMILWERPRSDSSYTHRPQ